MNFNFDKIYVLSLVTNKLRQEFIKQQFEDLNIDFEFIYGIDYNNIVKNIKDESIKYPNVWPTHAITKPGDFGCTAAHYQAVLQAYEFGYNNVLIIEDDICFIKDKNLLYECLNNIPKDGEFITWDPRFIYQYDNKHVTDEIISSNSLYIKLSDKYDGLIGGLMYAIMNKESMTLYLDNQRNKLSMSDHVLGFFRQPKVKRYLCTKCLCVEQYALICDFNCKFGHNNLYMNINKFNKEQFYQPEKYLEFTRV